MDAARVPVSSRFLFENARWLACGFLLAFGSSFGQTYFISVFSAPLRDEIGLTHSGFGALYMAATLTSAVLLVQFGRLVDHYPPERLMILIGAGLTLACVGMATMSSAALLFFVILGLRFFGQGLMSHTSQTLTARWFVATRGRALAISGLGYPIGAALFPLIAVGLSGVIGWRNVWLIAAAAAALIFTPLLISLLARPRQPKGSTPIDAVAGATGLQGKHWTRGEVVRSALFWMLVPAVMAPAFAQTIVFFLPDVIAEAKGQSLTAITALYPVHSLATVIASFSFGALVDRFSARAVSPYLTLAMMAGFCFLALSGSVAGLAVAMALLGITTGAFAAAHSALWAEMFGTAHIGAIKALAMAALVLGSAIGPGVAGALLDAGVSIEALCWGLAAYSAAASLFFVFVRRASR